MTDARAGLSGLLAVFVMLLARTATAEPAAAPTTTTATQDTVTVVGTPLSHTAGSAHVIRSDQLERYEHDDPQAVLATVPGVYARGEDGIGLRPNIGIRGVNPDRSKKVALLEDGIPFAPAPYSASAAYYFPLITRMTDVRVIKGPAAIAYGPQTIGGAIDLITRPIPSRTEGAVDLATGQYGYGKLHGWVGSSDDRIGFLAEAVHLRNDGFKVLPSGADTGSVRNEWMLKGSYVVDPHARERHEFRVKGTYSDEESNESYLGLTDAELRATPDRRYAASALDHMKWHRTAIALTHAYDPTKDFSITTTLYRNDLSRSWRKFNALRGASGFDVLNDPTNGRNAVYAAVLRGETDSSSTGEAILVGPNERTFAVHGIESRARWSTSTGPLTHRAEYGLRLHYDRIERRHSEDAFRMTSGQLVPEGSPTVVTAFNEASTEALAMHAVDAIGLQNLTITPGVRVEAMRSVYIDRAARTEQKRLTQALLPGIGAFYSLTRDLGVLAGVHRGFSPPVPGSGAEPELSVNYEAGTRFVRRRMRAEVIGFYNDYSNLTDTCTLSSGCIDANLDRQFNAGRARTYGLEAFAEHRIPLPVQGLEIPVNAAYTLTYSEFLRTFQSDDPIFGNVRPGDQMPYVPRHQANVSVGLEHQRAGGSVSMTYVSAMREIAGSLPLASTIATDDQVVFDASAYFEPIPHVRLYLNGRNLFDERYLVARRPYGARPNAPRWIQVGVKVSF
jgi:Fe(3+) dicitrate transport protein